MRTGNQLELYVGHRERRGRTNRRQHRRHGHPACGLVAHLCQWTRVGLHHSRSDDHVHLRRPQQPVRPERSATGSHRDGGRTPCGSASDHQHGDGPDQRRSESGEQHGQRHLRQPATGAGSYAITRWDDRGRVGHGRHRVPCPAPTNEIVVTRIFSLRPSILVCTLSIVECAGPCSGQASSWRRLRHGKPSGLAGALLGDRFPQSARRLIRRRQTGARGKDSKVAVTWMAAPDHSLRSSQDH